jgi:competence protein CoiA
VLYAKSTNSDDRVQATPGSRAACPGCNARVIAKCGEINIWHWAHEAGKDCDPWSEGESSWHLDWKAKATPSRCEVTIGPHRADIVNRSGTVIEFQHSPLTQDQVREREEFYGDMVWLVDGIDFRGRFHVHNGGDACRFVWPNARKWMYAIRRPLYLDFRDDAIFFVDRLSPNIPSTFVEISYSSDGTKNVESDGKACNGTGWYLTGEQFVARWIGPKSDPTTDWEAHKKLRGDGRAAVVKGWSPGLLPFGDESS